MKYTLLDSGQGRKLEKFGEYILDRPDPQILWQKSHPELWATADAVFDEVWQTKTNIPHEWQVEVAGLKVWAKLTPFKHTGIFPEQIDQWEFIKGSSAQNVLTLFGYTGISALCAAKAGAKVTYVDASKQALNWARKNQDESGLGDKPIRWILDDALKFVEREGRRGNKYDAIIMDPPVFGHGPDGETWEFNKSLPALMEALKPLLDKPLKFVIINAYAVSTSSVTLVNLLQDLTTGLTGNIEAGELVLQADSGRQLSTGIFAKWCAN